MERTTSRGRHQREAFEDCPLAAAIVRFLIWATRNEAPGPDRRISVPSARPARAAQPETK
jgi:hypothetical protein